MELLRRILQKGVTGEKKADLPHRLSVAEDALILTIRWPSTPEEKQEPVQSGGTAQE